MKKYTLLLLALFAIIFGAEARKMSDLKIYINPGHGGYTSNDRPIRIHPYASNDSNGYWESKSNLYKGLFMYHMLDSLGATAYMSRTKNTEDDDRSLSGICTEANNLGVDMLISIHSNAGESVNYPLMLYREQTEGTPRYPEAVTLSKLVWKNLHSNQLPYWTHNSERVCGDLTFYKNMWSGGLGVLRTLYVVGLLSEGSMHEHRPEAHRLMNMDVCWLEAWHFVKSIMEFYETEDRFVTGNVAGVVYDTHNLRESVMPAIFSQYGRDKLAPLNGSYIELVDAAGNVVQKRMTDNDYNGCFVFRNVAPGNYTLKVSHDGYYNLEKPVTVTACEVTYQDLGMDMKREYPLQVVSYGPQATPGAPLISCSSTIDFEFNTDIDTESFEANLKIEPAVEGYFTYSESFHKASFHPTLSFARDTKYKVTLGKATRHPDPNYATPGMEADLEWEFITKGRDRLELTAHYPADGGEMHIGSPSVEFQFDYLLSSTNLYKIFTLTDSKGNAMSVNSRNSQYNKLSNDFGNVVYAISSDLTEGETYTARLTSELRDKENLPLSSDITFTFKAVDVTKESADAVVVEDFESSETLFAYDPELTLGIGTTKPAVARSTTDKLFDKSAAKFTYKFTDTRGGEVVWNYLGEPVIYNKGEKIGAFVNGNASGHEIAFGLLSGTDMKYASLGTLDFRGWKYITVDLDMLEEGYPYQLATVKLTQETSPIWMQGSFGIDNITRQAQSSISEVSAEAAVAVFPNPASDYIRVQAPASVERIELVNLQGIVLESVAGRSAMSVGAYAPGLYFLRVYTAAGCTTLRLVIK